MASQSKNVILENHKNNALLNAATPAPMLRDNQDFSADEIYAPIDERIITAATEALEAGQTHYVDVPGIAPLRAAVAQFLNESSAANYAQGNIIVTAGVQESRFLTIQMIGEQFERIAIPAVVHPGAKRALGVRAMNIDTIAVDERMLATAASIRELLESGTRLFYLESPSRLTGAAYSAEEVSTLAGLLSEFNASAIWDQGLAPWTEGYASLAAHEGIKDQIALIGDTWPGSGLASWFIAYIAAPEAWIPSMQSQKQIMAICTSTASQYAVLEASKLYAEHHAHSTSRLSQMRDALVAQSSKAGFTPIPGAAVNVLAVSMSAEQKTAAMAKLNQAGYAVTDGSDFGAESCIRLTLSPNADSDNLIAALTA